MLSTEETHEIDLEIKKFPYRQSACLEALAIVQNHRGYVSDEALKAVAQYLEMSSTELDGIATFYNLIYRKPVGDNVIRICDSVSCWILGYDKVKATIKNSLGIDLGQTTPDNQFTLLPTQCLGTCDHGPALMIGSELYRDLNEKNVVQILKSYQKKQAVKDVIDE
jgi:NADH-quinone oxidoreductase subunit E